MQSLKGKVAVITGASSGIGAALAAYFAKHGSRLSLAGRKQDNLEAVAQKTGLGEKDVLSTIGDLTVANDRQNLVEKTKDKFGKIDILINNAAIFPTGMLADMEGQVLEDCIRVNLTSHMTLTKLAIPHLVQSKGNIVNISAVLSELPIPGLGVYSISKAALDMFTRLLSQELASRGVRVNSVNPAYIQYTNLIRRGNPNITDDMEKQIIEDFRKLYPLGRLGCPDDVTNAVGFLASDNASFITGETITIDGGLRYNRGSVVDH